jgi:hypothetical protein
MMEGKEQSQTADAAEARKEEATSSETLAEIEETQEVNTTTGGAAGTSSPDVAPAPDGTPDPDRGSSADGRESGGPM